MTYIAIYNDNYLAHHGVKGMKWGVRKKSPIASGMYSGKQIGKTGMGRGNSRYFVYQNKRGKNKATGVGPGTLMTLRRKGITDGRGNIVPGRENDARKIIKRDHAIAGALLAGSYGISAATLGSAITVNGRTINSHVARGIKKGAKGVANSRATKAVYSAGKKVVDSAWNATRGKKAVYNIYNRGRRR